MLCFLSGLTETIEDKLEQRLIFKIIINTSCHTSYQYFTYEDVIMVNGFAGVCTIHLSKQQQVWLADMGYS